MCLQSSKIKYSKPQVERGLKRLHLVQVKIGTRDYVPTRGTIYSVLEGLQLSLRRLYIIFGIYRLWCMTLGI